MATHHAGVSVGPHVHGTGVGDLDLPRDRACDHFGTASASASRTVDIAVTEWVADLSIPGSSALGSRTTHSARDAADTLVAAVGYVDYDAIDSVRDASVTSPRIER